MGNLIAKLNIANFRKAIRYCKKNGFTSMYYAAKERALKSPYDDYTYCDLEETEVERQKKDTFTNNYKISILVPAYETKETYLEAMIQSVLVQTYENWELIIADASASDHVKKIVSTYEDARICYLYLGENKGISENSNAGLQHATGDYIGLLDHDDELTKDALYEVVNVLNQNDNIAFLYSDEDKMDENSNQFFDPHIKKEFDLDLLLSNNYICHFLVAKSTLIKKIGFRKIVDGAQDFDLVLRMVNELMGNITNMLEAIDSTRSIREQIAYIPKILYHWRCHSASTAANPASKMYAYESGKQAIEHFLSLRKWNAVVEHSKHLGFYHVSYLDSNGKKSLDAIFSQRPEVLLLCGNIIEKNRVVNGPKDKDGNPLFFHLNRKFSGYMNRKDLRQQVYEVDMRCIKRNPELPYINEKQLWGMNRIGFALIYEPQMEEKGTSGINYFQSLYSNNKVTVVIPNFNGIKYIKNCLASLEEQEWRFFRTVVVDNNSTDGSQELIKEQFPHVRLIELKENTGFANAVNVGIQQCKDEYVILLNNDTTVEKDFIKQMVVAMHENKTWFSASSKMVTMADSSIIDDAGDYYNAFGWAYGKGKGKPSANYTKNKNIFASCAGAAIYRRYVFIEIGYFDDNHFAYLEDIDIGYRSRIYGYENGFVANAICHHEGSASSGSRYNEFKISLSSKNSVYLIYKNMPLLQFIINLPFLCIGFLIKTIFFIKKKHGIIYLKGLCRGVGFCFTKEAKVHKVRFRIWNIKHYIQIQIQLWINIFRMFTH